jgi:hexulose-6-phosphate isomerase
MQAPFWKAAPDRMAELQRDFVAIVRACSEVGIRMVVVPLVDGGRLESRQQEDLLVAYLLAQVPMLAETGVSIVFESDYLPADLALFMRRLPAAHFGVNYDSGNSASLGFHPTEEFACYGDRVVNVHIKDRVRGGTTVPLGSGDADFPALFTALAARRYPGLFILQTARAADGRHGEVLRGYRDTVQHWLREYGMGTGVT